MAGLLRYQIFLGYGAVFFALWYAALQNIDELLKSSPYPHVLEILIRYAPFWALVALAVYALVTILVGLINFNDCPEAAAELEQQIQEARKEMKRRGIITD